MPDLSHPQYSKDRALLNQLIQDAKRRPVPDLVLAEIARLRIRYMGFPGVRDIQQDLDTLLDEIGLTESALFAQTREIHKRKTVYQESFSKRDDWA